MNPKRVKAMGLYMEKRSNTHPQLVSLDPKLKEQIKNKFSEDAEYQYYRWRNEELQFQDFFAAQEECDIEAENNTLPRNILSEMR